MSKLRLTLRDIVFGALTFYCGLWIYHPFPHQGLVRLAVMILPLITSIMSFIYLRKKLPSKPMGSLFLIGIWLLGGVNNLIFSMIDNSSVDLFKSGDWITLLHPEATFIAGGYIGYLGALIILAIFYPIFDLVIFFMKKIRNLVICRLVRQDDVRVCKKNSFWTEDNGRRLEQSFN